MTTNIKHSRSKEFNIRTVFIVAFSCMFLALGACSSDDDDDDDENSTPQSNTVTFAITADDSQQLSPSGSTATGSGSLTLDSDTGALSGSVETTGITATAAHIHDGFAGTDGGVVLTLDISGATISVPDDTVLDADQITAMNAGQFYLNVHTDAFPGGEIRAQIAPKGAEVILAALAGDNEVPPVTSSATGTAFITINNSSGAIVINVITTGITTPEAAHLHSAFAGSNGGVVVPLVQNVSEVGNFSAASDSVLDTTALANFMQGGTYINVHSAENQSGELRGQVLPAGVSILSATLSGDQEVPPVATAASGTGFVTLNENDSSLVAIISTTGVDDATAAHIHEAAVGSNGGVVLALEQDATSAGVWSATASDFTSAQIATLKAGGMYFNVHTPANASGELRGQIE